MQGRSLRDAFSHGRVCIYAWQHVQRDTSVDNSKDGHAVSIVRRSSDFPRA